MQQSGRAEGRRPGRSAAAAREPGGTLLVESKLTVPAERPGEVARPALVDRVLSSPAPVVSIVGPAGYGKTTLLRQVAAAAGAEGRPVAWVALDARDDDPTTLVAYVVEALSRIGPISRSDLGAVTSRAAPLERVVLPRLASIVGGLRARTVVILDDVHVIRGTAGADVLGVLADHMPAGAVLVLAGRGDPALPLARLRVSGRLQELGIDDLALGPADAAQLARGIGVAIDKSDLPVLLAETEGWPTAIYLAAIASRSGSVPGQVGVGFSGRDRHMADYIRQELLDPLPASTRAFMMESSVLERMTAALCDDVLDRDDAAILLPELERTNRLVVALDRERHWYRYHPLLRDVLRADLDASDRERAGAIAARASAWFVAEGDAEEAVDLARQSGDRGLFVATVGRYLLAFHRKGRSSTVLRWLAELDADETLAAHPDLAILGAISHALAGDPVATDRWADAAEAAARREGAGRTPPTLALLAAIRCRSGPEAMLLDADEALVAMGPRHPLRSPALYARGGANMLLGRTAEATADMEEAAALGAATGSVDAAVGAAASLASVLASTGAWSAARRAAGDALDLVRTFGTEHYQSSGIARAMAARVAIREGRRDDALGELVRAQVLRPFLSYAIPWMAVLTQVELGRAYLALGDAAGARTAIREAREVITHRPRLGILPDQVDALRAAVDAHAAGIAGASSLTRAEFRLLPYLPFHLTFDEIADRWTSRRTRSRPSRARSTGSSGPPRGARRSSGGGDRAPRRRPGTDRPPSLTAPARRRHPSRRPVGPRAIRPPDLPRSAAIIARTGGCARRSQAVEWRAQRGHRSAASGKEARDDVAVG